MSQTRKSPAGNGALSESTTRDCDQDTRSNLPFAELEAQAVALGVKIAVRCRDCGHYIVTAESRAANRGPRCRARSAKVVQA